MKRVQQMQKQEMISLTLINRKKRNISTKKILTQQTSLFFQILYSLLSLIIFCCCFIKIYRYDRIVDWLKTLATKYPFIQLVNIGNTTQGKKNEEEKEIIQKKKRKE